MDRRRMTGLTAAPDCLDMRTAGRINGRKAMGFVMECQRQGGDRRRRARPSQTARFSGAWVGSHPSPIWSRCRETPGRADDDDRAGFRGGTLHYVTVSGEGAEVPVGGRV